MPAKAGFLFCEKQSDQLVYQQAVSELKSSAYKLYGLTPEEIAIVEGK